MSGVYMFEDIIVLKFMALIHSMRAHEQNHDNSISFKFVAFSNFELSVIIKKQ
jgi:hypothetical protein